MRVKSVFHSLALVFGLCAAVPSLSQSATEVGTVERLSGSVSVNAAGTVRIARAGERLVVGEILVTDAGAEALVRFRDDSTMALRSNTQVTVTEFRFQEREEGLFSANLLKGVVRSISGLIGKTRPRGVTFRTPTATVGIRGTDFELAIVEPGERDRAGVYNHVHEGSTNLALASGDNLDLASEQTGFAPQERQAGEPAILLLRERPAFLRGGGFDALMLQTTRPVPIMPMMRR
jgi:hypothetical protein